MKKLKKSAALALAAMVMAGSLVSIPAQAGSTSWSTPYGNATGSCSTYKWGYSSTPTFRAVTATTTVANAAPNISAKITAYYNGNAVMSNENTGQDRTSVTARSDSSEYANKTVTLTGIHAVWSSSFARKDHISTN